MLPFDPIEPAKPLFQSARISHIISETSDVKTFHLKTARPLSYRPGQFLTFNVRPGVRRSYSISTIPSEGLAVTVKRIPNGEFSRPLIDVAVPGDELVLAGGAAGFFTLPPADAPVKQLLFFAAGSGITPILSLIKQCLGERPEISLLLIYSNKSPAETIFRMELLALEKKSGGRLNIIWRFSDNQNLLEARLNKEGVASILNSRMTDPARTLFYLCGPFDYMRMIAIVLQAAGIREDQIKREIFLDEKPFSPEIPADTDSHQVIIRFRGGEYTVNVQYPESILRAAIKNRIELPYSCEAGRCGSCVASCTSGKVWMKYNEVLTDRETEKGRVLICNAFPVGGDAVIEFDS